MSFDHFSLLLPSYKLFYFCILSLWHNKKLCSTFKGIFNFQHKISTLRNKICDLSQVGDCYYPIISILFLPEILYISGKYLLYFQVPKVGVRISQTFPSACTQKYYCLAVSLVLYSEYVSSSVYIYIMCANVPISPPKCHIHNIQTHNLVILILLSL